MKTSPMSLDDPNFTTSSIEEMTNFQLARWASLVEAVNIIAEKAEEKSLKFKRISLKQPALRKYIESTCDIICRKMDEEDHIKEIRRLCNVRGSNSNTISSSI